MHTAAARNSTFAAFSALFRVFCPRRLAWRQGNTPQSPARSCLGQLDEWPVETQRPQTPAAECARRATEAACRATEGACRATEGACRATECACRATEGTNWRHSHLPRPWHKLSRVTPPCESVGTIPIPPPPSNLAKPARGVSVHRSGRSGLASWGRAVPQGRNPTPGPRSAPSWTA
jgi:hypothetical protein